MRGNVLLWLCGEGKVEGGYEVHSGQLVSWTMMVEVGMERTVQGLRHILKIDLSALVDEWDVVSKEGGHIKKGFLAWTTQESGF